MSIFKELSGIFHYYLDNLNVIKLKATIDHFKFEGENGAIIVFYRLGRQKLLSKMEVLQFEEKYFSKISSFDKHRLTKLSTLQSVLQNLFFSGACEKASLIAYIQKEIKNERFL